METRPVNQFSPLVVIVGPTASGKTSLAIEIARLVNGEVINADSRSVYIGMDIGTAKPTMVEQGSVPHWGLDLIHPNESFSVVDFKGYASQKIKEIRKRGHVPILVGGTGLYIDAVIFDYQFGSKINNKLRLDFEKMTSSELYNYCLENNIKLPENYKNKRYLIRAIERKDDNLKKRDTPINNTIVVGISTNREELRNKIKERTEQIFNKNIVEEATLLAERYGWDGEAMTANIYRLIRKYIDNEITLEEAKQKFTTLDWRLAKRQLTWLNRNPYIYWGNRGELYRHLLKALANK